MHIGLGFNSGAGGPFSLWEMVEDIGAEANALACWDAASLDGYTGSGTSLLDLSGNGNALTMSSTASQHPTFNGVAGSLSQNEYFESDGGDFFTDHTNVLTFADSFHQNNAQITMFGVAYNPLGASTSPILAGSDKDAETLPRCYPLFATSFPIIDNSTVNNWGVQVFFCGDGSDTSQFTLRFINRENRSFDLDAALDVKINTGSSDRFDKWNFWAVSLNEATGASGGILQLNNTQTLFTSTYDNPVEQAPYGPSYSIGRAGAQNSAGPNTVNAMRTGARFGCMYHADRKWTASELNEIYALLRERYTDLP